MSSLFTLGCRLRGAVVLLWLLQMTGIQAQQSPALHPPDYPGVKTFIPGVFVTPVPGAPFSGTVEIVSRQSMPDGSIYVRRTTNHIARNSLGIIYNERRRLEPPGFQGEPPILSSHIYDPHTRVSTFFSPDTYIARQMVLSGPPVAPANSTPNTSVTREDSQNLKTQDLGTETVAGLLLRGTRKLKTISATLSGTGREVTITDDYWYSEDLKVYLVLKHNDPRTGEQIVGIVTAERNEPDPITFQIPPGYKILDETPVQQARP